MACLISWQRQIQSNKMEQQYLSVSALNKYIKLKFDHDTHLQVVYLKAEISNFKHHSRGHLYFTLKDESARIQAVMFKQHAQNLACKPEDGMNVFIKGNVNVFESQGNYQIYVEEMVDAGAGNFALEFEKLKQKLDAAGYFALERKRQLPQYPQVIGIVTSPTGAAVKDILTTLQRRAPYAQVFIFPALVQGEQAKYSIVQAIESANNFPNIDVLIVGRGGGSIEDLWAFNEEIVASAILTSKIPIISAVGHEVDTTIADFVADVRAATPTAAAEIAAVPLSDLQQQLQQTKQRLVRELHNQYRYQKLRIDRVQQQRFWQQPQILLQTYEQRFDTMYARFIQQRPLQQIQVEKQQLQQLEQRLYQQIVHTIQRKATLFELQRQKLHAYSPLHVMKRGYTLTMDEQSRRVIRSATEVVPNQLLSVKFYDGIIKCHVNQIEHKGE